MSKAKERRRMRDKEPRTAYCNGCGDIFDMMHLLRIHRETQRCGGRFLPEEERILWALKTAYDQMFECTGLPEHRQKSDRAFTKAVILRKRRLADANT